MVRGLLLVILAVGVVPAADAQIVVNGSFEVGPSFSSQDLDVAAGSTALDGWVVTGVGSSAIDYLGSPWDVSDGVHAVDLDGRDSLGSGIQQTFSTTPGQSYVVSFDLSGNPGTGAAGTGLPTIKSIRVTVADVLHDYQFDSTGQSITTLNWVPISFSFVASDITTTLAFTSLTGFANSYGALIDHVSVVPGFAFHGFFAPIENDPAVNSVRAGAAIPVKFNLGGSFGLDIFANGFPASQPVACDSFAQIAPVEETVSAGQSGLTYDAALEQYTYVWKTSRSWANTCRQLVLRLADGSFHVAAFRFER